MPKFSDEARKQAEEMIDDLVRRGELIRDGADRIIEADLFFARDGWELASLEIATRSGNPARRSGYARKGLFIHCMRGEWVVTHCATGHKIMGFTGPPAAQAALTFGEAIAGLTDWERIESLEAWENVRSARLIAAIKQAAVAVYRRLSAMKSAARNYGGCCISAKI